MVVILAAGKSSRMKNLPKGESKCSVLLPDGRSTVRRLIDQFKVLGEYNFTVIVGYGAESVVREVGTGECKGEIVNFIYNGKYDTRGCEYSLSLCAPAINPDNEDLIVVEGDLVTTTENLKRIFDHKGTSVLTRPREFLGRKSVAVLCNDESTRVIRFIYDQLHVFDMKTLSEIRPCLRVYDSFQVWKFSSGEDLRDFKFLLEKYRADSDYGCKDQEYQFASGLLSINEFIGSRRIEPLSTAFPEDWINLNSEEDLKLLNDKSLCSWFYKVHHEIDDEFSKKGRL